MADVFLSYARANAKKAKQAAAALRDAGYSVWFDESLPAHRAYSDVIAAELDAALNGDQELAQYAESGDDFGSLGTALGHELVDGQGTPTWSSLSSNRGCRSGGCARRTRISCYSGSVCPR